MFLQRGNYLVLLRILIFSPYFNPFVGRARVYKPVFRNDGGVDGVVMGPGDGLKAFWFLGFPNLDGSVPGDGDEESLVGGEGRNGVVVFDPELLLVAADFDVVVGEDEAEEAVFEGGEGGEEFVAFEIVIEFPDADFAVLMTGENFSGGERDGLDGAGGGFLGVEGVEEGVGYGFVDVDLVAGGGIEEVVVEGEVIDVGGGGGTVVGLEGGEERGGGGGGVLVGGEGEFLEGRDRREGEEREIGLDAGVA